ncbi:MAG: deoxyribodipyrimidine photo-lyase [Candidatus Eisenbacteria bacterium]|nr:deoxyribodipyrimidine photo-lyase [Candidatus Eisenbacteria bacterium]
MRSRPRIIGTSSCGEWPSKHRCRVLSDSHSLPPATAALTPFHGEDLLIQPERIHFLNEREPRPSGYVLYWMQQAQRVRYNHALEFAVREANERGLPLLAVFGITRRFPLGQIRHYAFMLEGLRETEAALRKRGVKLVLRLAAPNDAVSALSHGAAVIVTDAGYLRIQRAWRGRVARAADCRVVEVESDVIVPVRTVSKKEEYAARTIRPRIHEHVSRFLKPLEETRLERPSTGIGVPSLNISDLDAILRSLSVPGQAQPVRSFTGGASRAAQLLGSFLKKGLRAYPEGHGDPGCGIESGLSPYLHFGQISPLEIALAVASARSVPRAARDSFLEELIVRRELAMNFCFYNETYDRYDCLPEWARNTLSEHATDARDYVYSYRQLERAETHDPYWNAAQDEMVLTGKMHGYMRMYWGKKIIEWSRTPEDAFERALKLNNVYELDGRDPNSFAGVAWCFGKHDRPWKERPVFGKVRWMSAEGLRRKFDMDAYLERVESLRVEREKK